MDMTQSALAVPAQAWRRVLHDAQLRPGNVKAWLLMGWPKKPRRPGDEADLTHRLAGLDRRHPGESAAIIRYLEEQGLVTPGDKGRHRITEDGCLRSQ